MTLIRGDDGYFQNKYIFPCTITSVDCYQDETIWKLVLITGAFYYCLELVFNSPSIEPSIVLPNSGGADLCLLESEEYHPGRGGLTVVGECQVEVMILDISNQNKYKETGFLASYAEQDIEKPVSLYFSE